jgi:hypothetical protein
MRAERLPFFLFDELLLLVLVLDVNPVVGRVSESRRSSC